MIINLNDWDFDALKIKLKKSTLTEMQTIYIYTEKNLTEHCKLKFKYPHDNNIEIECNKLYQEKLIIASFIADRLTGVESVL